MSVGCKMAVRLASSAQIYRPIKDEDLFCYDLHLYLTLPL